MELTEEKLFEAFGVDKAGREQGGSDPAAEGSLEQENQDQTVLDGQGTGEENWEEPENGQESLENHEGERPDQGQKEQGKRSMSPEERRENAARRRRQETQQAIDRAVEQARREEQDKAQEQMKSFFTQAGLKNSITGKPITNMDEFEAWKKDYNEARIQKELKSGKLTKDTLDQVIAENPVVKQAQEIIRQNQEQARAQAQRQAQERIDQELAEIHKMDPSINGVQDFVTMPNAKAFYEYVKKGNTFLDAYRLANFDKITTAKADAARQQAMTNARGKDHLRGAGVQQGAGAAEIPPDEMKLFKLLNPTATEDQIRAYYNKTKKKE